MSIEVDELRKYNDLKPEWEMITDFLSWLSDHDVFLAESYGPERIRKAEAPLKDMLADYYDVDLIQVEKEKNDLADYYLNNVLALQGSM